MDIFSRFDIRNPEIEITPDAQQTNVLFPSQSRWNNFKVGWDIQSNFPENVCPQQVANMLQCKCDRIAFFRRLNLPHMFRRACIMGGCATAEPKANCNRPFATRILIFFFCPNVLLEYYSLQSLSLSHSKYLARVDDSYN